MPVICNLPTKNKTPLSLVVGTVTDLGYGTITHPNVTTITHSVTTSYPLRMQQYVDMIEDYLPEFTLESDTGTGTSRVIMYSADCLGSSKYLKLWHYNNGTVAFSLATSDGTALNTYNEVGSYSYERTSQIIRNGTTLLIEFYMSGTIQSCFLVSKSGSLSIADAGYINFGGVVYLASDLTESLGLQYPYDSSDTSDNFLVAYPVFMKTSTSVITTQPIDNLYTTRLPTGSTVSSWDFCTVGEHTYLAMYSCISVNGINLLKID